MFRHYAMLHAVAIAAAIALGAGGHAGESKKAPSPPYQTPQEVFEVAKIAAEKGDLKAFVATLSRESRDARAGSMVLSGALLKQIGPQFAKSDEGKAKLKSIDAVLDKHGIDADVRQAALDTLAAMKEAKGKPGANATATKELARYVKERNTFLAEMMAVLGTTKADHPVAQLKAGRLATVAINGDAAKGTIVIGKAGKEQSEPIEFRKETGGWKLHLDPDRKKATPPKS